VPAQNAQIMGKKLIKCILFDTIGQQPEEKCSKMKTQSHDFT
jgi:hypothetical protein